MEFASMTLEHVVLIGACLMCVFALMPVAFGVQDLLWGRKVRPMRNAIASTLNGIGAFLMLGLL